MSFTGKNTVGEFREVFKKNDIRRRYVKILDSGLFRLSGHEFAKANLGESQIYHHSVVVAPPKPINFINLTFHVSNSENEKD